MASDGGVDRPRPCHAGTPAEFVAAMRLLKSWAGLSFRQLERRAAQIGETLPRTTVTSALSRDRVPQEHLVTAFARACGCEDDEVREWIQARKRVAVAATATDLENPHPTPPAAAPPTPAEQPIDASPPREDVSPTEVSPSDTSSADVSPAAEPSAPAAPAGGAPGFAVRRRWAAGLALAVLLVAFGATVMLDDRLDGALRDATGRSVPGPAPETASPPPLRIPPPTAAQLRRPPAAAVGASTVLYVGDAIVGETAGAVAYFVQSGGRAKVVSVTRSRAALCDFLAPGRDSLAELVERTKPRAVVLQFWGHSSTTAGCTGAGGPESEEYYQRYLQSARQTVRQIGAAAGRAGIGRPRLVWVLQGPDRARPERVRRLNEEIYQEVADENGDLVSDAGLEISLASNVYEPVRDGRYKWTGFLPCDETERRYGLCTHPRAFGGVTQLHPDHDARRLCRSGTAQDRCTVISPGVIRYARVIAQTVLQSL